MADAPGREEGPDAAEADAAEARLNRLLNAMLDSAVEVLGFDRATFSARQGRDVATIGATTSA